MAYEPEGFQNDPLDDELALVMSSAAEIIAYAKRSESIELVLPITDESGFWILSVKKMGISEDS